MKDLLRQLGHEVWSNNDQAGAGGYQLPALIGDDNRTYPWIIDCFCRLKSGAMIAFEIQLNHATKDIKKTMLWRFGIVTIEVPPSYVDEWVVNPALLEAEIDYNLKRAKKLYAFAKSQA